MICRIKKVRICRDKGIFEGLDDCFSSQVYRRAGRLRVWDVSVGGGEESHVAGIIAEVRDSVAKLRSVDPDAVPMAFWDFDGTIIKGDSGLDYEEGGKVCYRGLIPETIRAGVCPAYKGEDGVRRWKAEWSRMKEHGSWLSQGFDVQMYHGVEARVLDEFCERNLRENRMFDWFFTSSLAIWKALGELGVENYVVSANVEALENAAQVVAVVTGRGTASSAC